MRTDKQRQASRANGAKSRGPVTAAGKSISSRNATRHGVLADILTLKLELRDEFLDLVTRLFDEFQPRTPFEESLVETMAAASWRLSRIWSIQSAALNLEVDRQTSTENCTDRVALAMRELSDHSRSLDVMSRYELRYERQYLRFHRRLMEVQGIRTPPPASPFLVPKREKEVKSSIEPAEPVEITETKPVPLEGGAGTHARSDQHPLQGCWHGTLAAVPTDHNEEAARKPNSQSQQEEKNPNPAFS